MLDKAVRWSGLLIVSGAVLLGTLIVMASLNPTGNHPQPILMDVLPLVSSILLLLSFPGMYFRQAREAGWLGLAGYWLLQIGLLLPLVTVVPQLRNPSYNPPGGDNAVDGLLAVSLILGLLTTGIASLMAKVFPRWAAIILLTASAVLFFAFFVGETLPSIASQISGSLFGILLGSGFAWIGVDMLIKGYSHQAPDPTKRNSTTHKVNLDSA